MDVELLKGLLSDFFRENGAELAVLFGSSTGEKESLKRDVDIAIRMKKGRKLSARREMVFIGELCHALGRDDVDVVMLDHTSPLLAAEVALHGRVIYERRRGLFSLFQWDAVRRWCDNKKFHALQDRYVEKQLGMSRDEQS